MPRSALFVMPSERASQVFLIAAALLSASCARNAASVKPTSSEKPKVHSRALLEQHLAAAVAKKGEGDSAGCLRELDAGDRAYGFDISTSSETQSGHVRTICMMMNGQCKEGRARLEQSLVSHWVDRASRPHQTHAPYDRYYSAKDIAAATEACPGDLAISYKLSVALDALDAGTKTRKGSGYCNEHYMVAKQAKETLDSLGGHPLAWTSGSSPWQRLHRAAPRCFAVAEDCESARASFEETSARSRGDEAERVPFEERYPLCSTDPTGEGRGRTALAELRDRVFARDRSSPWCDERVERIRAVEAESWTARERDQLWEASARCYATALNCEGALNAVVELHPMISASASAERRKAALAVFNGRWHFRHCRDGMALTSD